MRRISLLFLFFLTASLAMSAAVNNNKDRDGDNLLTPKYLKIKGFKKCLAVKDDRGWQGYCKLKNRPEACPEDSWQEIQKMNIIECDKD